jgi:hypothetical protein
MNLDELTKLNESKGRNVINVDELDNYIGKIINDVPSDRPNIRKWFQKNLRKWMINSFEGVVQVNKARAGLPDWLVKQAGGPESLQDFLDNNEVFELELDEEFSLEMRHVIDWFLVHSRPQQDLSRWDVGEVLNKAHNWSGEDDIIQSSNDVFDDSDGVEVLMSFNDGSRWISIKPVTDKDLPSLAKDIPLGMQVHNYTLSSTNPVMRRETYFMRHCIGSGYGYDEALKSGRSQFYSLRDKNNEPHVTIEANKKRVLQLHGKNNQAPDHKYTPAIIAFLNNYQMDVDDGHYLERARIMKVGEGKNAKYFDRFGISKLPKEELAKLNFTRNQLRKLGLVRVDNELAPLEEAKTKFSREQLKNSDLTNEELESIGLIKTSDGELLSWSEMAGKEVEGNRDFINLLADPELPDNITFSDNVTISGWGWRGGAKTLPKKMHVKGNLIIRESSRLGKLPQDLKVDGRFEINNCVGLKNFPMGKFDNVVISECGIEEITKVEIQSLSLSGTSVKRIGPKVSLGDLSAKGSNLSDIDSSVHIRGYADLSETAITSFKPKKVGHSLDLSNSKCSKLPEGLKVGEEEIENIEVVEPRGSINLTNTPITKLPKGIRSITGDEGDDDPLTQGIVTFPSNLENWPEDFVASQVWFGAKVAKKPLPKDCHITVSAVNVEETVDNMYNEYYAADGELTPGEPPTVKVETD